jgi:hypothetical protein
VELDHALLCGDLLQRADVYLAQQLNVDGPTLHGTQEQRSHLLSWIT